MTTKHTPGPWVAECEGGSYGVFDAADGRELARLHDARGNFPQSSFADTQYLYEGQHEANARVMAAAPALLSVALDVEWSALVDDGCGGEEPGCPWCEQRQRDGHDQECQLADAIAQATGGAA